MPRLPCQNYVLCCAVGFFPMHKHCMTFVGDSFCVTARQLRTHSYVVETIDKEDSEHAVLRRPSMTIAQAAALSSVRKRKSKVGFCRGTLSHQIVAVRVYSFAPPLLYLPVRVFLRRSLLLCC